MPGQEKTFSTSTLAPSVKENTMPSVVNSGLAALRSAYTKMIFQRGRLEARAVRMKSAESTWSMAARVMRASGARAKMPRVSAGRVICITAARKVSKSPARRVSMRKKPVTASGSMAVSGSRPMGAGAHPSR